MFLSFFLLNVKADDAAIYGVEDFGEGLCCPTCSDLTWAINQAQKVDEVFQDWIDDGYWENSYLYDNTDVKAQYFTDANLKLHGDDLHPSYGVDTRDISYISTHGWHKCLSGEEVYMSAFIMGVNEYECPVNTALGEETNSGPDIHFNNSTGDLDIMIVDACQSSQYCVWNNDGYSQVDGSDFRMWAGFHGNSEDSWTQSVSVSNYVSSSRLNGVGSNWLDYRYDWEAGDDNDHCPTTIIWGSSTAVINDFYNYAGFDDRDSTGIHSYTKFFYVCDCDPENGNLLACD